MRQREVPLVALRVRMQLPCRRDFHPPHFHLIAGTWLRTAARTCPIFSPSASWDVALRNRQMMPWYLNCSNTSQNSSRAVMMASNYQRRAVGQPFFKQLPANAHSKCSTSPPPKKRPMRKQMSNWLTNWCQKFHFCEGPGRH
jgi:hypothetical protein